MISLKEFEIINDPTFKTGFNLLGYSPIESGRNTVLKLDYNRHAIVSKEDIWYMSQWWTPFNVANSIYSYKDGCHIYKTNSRVIKVNPADYGYLHIELLGSKEYHGSTRKSADQSWAHALIEQNFLNKVVINNLESLYVSLDFNIEKCICKNGVEYNPEIHAAQLLWYFTLSHVTDQESFRGYGSGEDFLWFGVPIFDSRFDFINHSTHIDSGSAGTTNKLIYSMDSRLYLDEKIEMGKDYKIHVDILPYLKSAYNYAIKNGLLKGCKLENMLLSYMNFGWELPGAFDVSSTIRNMSIKAVMK